MSAAAEPQLVIAVYDCLEQSKKISDLAKTITEFELYAPTDKDKLGKFDKRVQPWKDDCKFTYHRYHFIATEGNKVIGWMLVDIRTHEPRGDRTWRYVYLDKVSVRNGTRGVGKALGDELIKWATNRGDIDFIWLWAIDKRVSDIYEGMWDYERVQYYPIHGSMFYTILRPPPLSRLQADMPESPRIYWVAADKLSKMNPPNEELIKLIQENRRTVDTSVVQEVLEPLMEILDDIPADEVPGVQNELIKALSKTGGRRKTARNTHRLRFLRKHHLAEHGYSLSELSKTSKVSKPILQQVYDRGIGAYKTNPTSVRMKGTFRKGVKAPYSKKLSKEQWAMARVYSFLDGNPKHDGDLRRKTHRNRK